MTSEKNKNLWKGELISDLAFEENIHLYKNQFNYWSHKPLNPLVLFKAIDRLKKQKTDSGEELYSELMPLLNIDDLRLKLKRELGCEYPFELKRINAREEIFESWYPLGILVHVTPNNSPLLSVLALLEGLMSGNVNVLKLGRKETSFVSQFYHDLCLCDDTNTIKNYIYIGKFSSQKKELMIDVLSMADAISAWGSEESIKSIRALAPSHIPIIEWGHKISFSYISKKLTSNQQVISNLAFEICNEEQLACSSPQCVFIEDANFEELKLFSNELKLHLQKVSKIYSRIEPDFNEQAEITISKEQVRLASLVDGMNESELVEDLENNFRIYIEMNASLKVSPLYRTIWLKPMPKKMIVDALRPHKRYLQTVGLACGREEAEYLVNEFFCAGIKRVRAIGEMTNSYTGEPHDGVYALSRFCKKISFNDSSYLNLMKGKFSFESTDEKFNLANGPIMSKKNFQEQVIENKYKDLYFLSGGSSGGPKLSVFTYDDYHRQMEMAAEGLYASGLCPKKDRCMNLFYAGSLYGGFISFFTILEKLNAIHLPMGANNDFKFIAKMIVDNKVDTLLGMPSFLSQLFKESEEILKNYNGIKKIFYGGEHFSIGQRNYLSEHFNIEVIRSASYGSVDAGPLGYQCEFSEGGVHHLHEKLHDLEIVELENDKPLSSIGQVGRMLFTSKVRHGQSIVRYEIGDVGRLLGSHCPCGRTGVRFELLGRTGDVFRIGTGFLSYQKFQIMMDELFQYSGAIQLVLCSGPGLELEKLILRLEPSAIQNRSIETIHKEIENKYKELSTLTTLDKVLLFEIAVLDLKDFQSSATTGKIKSVIDSRITEGGY